MQQYRYHTGALITSELKSSEESESESESETFSIECESDLISLATCSVFHEVFMAM
jgi:hypothetical protein